LITVENLTKQYAATTAVNGISFEVAEHEVLGFLGPNGAGKSTTLRILTGYLSATSGKVVVDGHDVFARPEEVKRVVGYLPESVPLYPELRVGEYLDYRAALKKVPRAGRKAAVDRAVERCQIGDVRRRIIGQLSKGYRQRVGLADALVGDPKILILDEPTIGLDPNQIRQVRDLIGELGRERTVILSSHILPEVEAVCSRIQIIHRGVLVGQGRPEELRSRWSGGGATLAVEVIDPDGKAADALAAVQGVTEVGDPRASEGGPTGYQVRVEDEAAAREAIFDAAVAAGFKLVGLGSEGASLEDIFFQITTDEAAPEPAASTEEGGGK
jgi:ABC-2 type transport system ATP-binding protein